ncbi:MAG: adenylate/guanylate cyclase domain-containing protein, partial [Bacteroidota bacterium]
EAYALNNLGRFYTKKGNYEEAIRYHKNAFDTAQKVDGTLYMAQSILYLGDAYYKKGDYNQAIETYNSAVFYALKISDKNIELKNAYAGLSLSYAQQKDFEKAYKYNQLLSQVKDTLYNIDLDKKMAGYQTSFDLYKKQGQIELLEKDRAFQEESLKRQKTVKNALIAGLVLVTIIIFIIYRDYRNKIKINKILDSQKAEIEHLLLNILPAEVAEELQKTGTATPKYYDKATVLFTDFKSFSKLADDMSPQEVVSELNSCFIAFDDIIDKYGLEKIKTIGDAYMCAGGIPTEDDSHVVRIIKASIEIQQWMQHRNDMRTEMGLPPWEIRIGINTGPIVAGVVGKKKYAYDIWGSAVNVASRMESNGEPGKVNISAATHELVKHKFSCTYRGKIFAKNIGEIDMFFVDRELDPGT